MAYDKVVDSSVLDAGLKQIADAIREKGGTSDSLAFPTAMAEAIAAIQAGGGDLPAVYRVDEIGTYGDLIGVELHGYTQIHPYAFYGSSQLELTEIPDGIVKIFGYAFEGCSKITVKSLPSSLDYISSRAFSKCTGITEMTFNSTPSYLSSSAFSGCTNLLTINVPWAEGAVSSAPWGATKATINYNYTEG